MKFDLTSYLQPPTRTLNFKTWISWKPKMIMLKNKQIYYKNLYVTNMRDAHKTLSSMVKKLLVCLMKINTNRTSILFAFRWNSILNIKMKNNTIKKLMNKTFFVNFVILGTKSENIKYLLKLNFYDFFGDEFLILT